MSKLRNRDPNREPSITKRRDPAKRGQSSDFLGDFPQPMSGRVREPPLSPKPPSTEFDDQDVDDLFELWWKGRLLKIDAKLRPEEFWDTRTAGEVADKGRGSIVQWIDEGKIHAVPNGATWRVQVASLKSYLRQQYVTKCV